MFRFEPSGISVEDSKGTKKLGGFDSIVVAIGAKPDNELSRLLTGKVPEIFVVGDAAQPREVMEALLEAQETAIKI